MAVLRQSCGELPFVVDGAHLTIRSSRDRFAASFMRYRVTHRSAAAQPGLTQVLEPMSETVECQTHGEQERTFVCQHLVDSLSTGLNIGFFWSHEPRGDAWCSQCEEMRIREGGESGDWNDQSQAFAGIQILCGCCYDRVKVQNGF